MTTTRNGKIAHLPLILRDDLNHRLDNGVPGHELLAWLNADPEAQRILAQYYPGRRITQQNLSEWRSGGYQDWVKLQETRHLTLQLAKESGIPETDINPRKVINALATITAAEFARTSQRRLRECTTLDERWKHVCEMTDHLSRLRQADLRNRELSLRQEERDYKLAAAQRAAQQAIETEARRQVLASLSEGRVPRVPNINPSNSSTGAIPTPNVPTCSRITHYASPATSATSNPRPPASNPYQSKNQVETAHFPSGTDPNQVRKFLTIDSLEVNLDEV